MQARADRKSCLGHADRRRKQACPRQLALPALHLFQHGHHAGYPYRAATDHCLMKRQRLAIRPEEQVFAHRCRRRLAAIPGQQALAVVIEQEGTASNAAGLRLDQSQHHLHGNRRIQCIAPCTQNLQPRLRGQRIGCSHGMLLPLPARLAGPAAGGFRVGRNRRQCGRAGSRRHRGLCARSRDRRSLYRAAPCQGGQEGNSEERAGQHLCHGRSFHGHRHGASTRPNPCDPVQSSVVRAHAAASTSNTARPYAPAACIVGKARLIRRQRLPRPWPASRGCRP